MRGISAKSLSDTLAAVTAAGASDALGSELFAAVATLDGSPALRRVLTDPSTEADAKAGLVAQLFGGKVGAGTLSVLEAAARGRWAAGRDLTDALETAGVSAFVAGTDADGLESALFDIGQTVLSDGDLRSALSDKAAPADLKAALLARIFSGKVGAAALALAQQAAVGRGRSFEKRLVAFSQTVAEQTGRLVADVRAAYPLTDGERERLATALSAKYGRPVHLNLVVDPALVGGLAVAVGDDVLDGTMSSRLEAARRLIAG